MTGPVKPIVLVHGYSAEGKARTVDQIYGSLPADLRRLFGPDQVLDLNLSRWISLSDGIALDDVSFAMERALTSAEFSPLLASGFHVVIHSTGALVVRNWIRLFPRRPSPIANLVHLAGANFGSGLAHIGRGVAARWARQIFQDVESGVRVLEELEFGAPKTLDLHAHFLQPGCGMIPDFGVREYCLIGSQTVNALRFVPIRYVKEDSSDNTVRTSAGNLNFNLVTIAPAPEAHAIDLQTADAEQERRLEGERVSRDWYRFDLSHLADQRPAVPFAVLYETAHFGDELGIVNGTRTRKQVLPLLVQALSAADDDAATARVAADWREVTRRTQAAASRLKATLTDWNRRNQYEGHSQLIFRVRDQFGAGVAEHDITFNSDGPLSGERLEKMIEDKHPNTRHPGITTFYLRTQQFEEREGRQVLVDRLDRALAVDFEITGHEPRSGEILYLPVRARLSPTLLRKIIQPFRTTVVDVTLLRLPSRKVFQVVKG